MLSDPHTNAYAKRDELLVSKSLNQEQNMSESMTAANKSRTLYRVVSLLPLLIVLGAGNLAAQSDPQFDKIYPFIGHWGVYSTNREGEDRGTCGGRLGDYGEKLNNCSMPVDQLPLNKRAEAWLKFMDIRLSPVIAECAEVSLPGVLSADTYISGDQNEIVMTNTDPSGTVTRDIWMDGRRHPLAEQLFQHGHSVGHWDGDDIIIETTNFTFDPDGIDDHLHLASSVRKKVTQRYHLVDDETMRLIITLEDPLFLTRPFKYAYIFNKKPGGPPPAFRDCDPESSRNGIIFGYPGNKYDENAYQ